MRIRLIRAERAAVGPPTGDRLTAERKTRSLGDRPGHHNQGSVGT